jgi:hypothetical protein
VSFGNQAWAALVCEVELRAGSAILRDFNVQWLHVLDPSAYTVQPYDACRQGSLIVFRFNGPAQSLTRAWLLAKVDNFLKGDLERLARHFDLDIAGKSKAQLRELIAEHVSNGEADFLERVALKAPKKDVHELLADDPLVEEAFKDMSEEDKMEFPDIRKAFEKRRLRDRLRNNKRKLDQSRLELLGNSGRNTRRRLLARRRASGLIAVPAAHLSILRRFIYCFHMDIIKHCHLHVIMIVKAPTKMVLKVGQVGTVKETRNLQLLCLIPRHRRRPQQIQRQRRHQQRGQRQRCHQKRLHRRHHLLRRRLNVMCAARVNVKTESCHGVNASRWPLFILKAGPLRHLRRRASFTRQTTRVATSR